MMVAMEHASREDRIHLLQGTPIFGAVSEEALDLVLERAEVVTVHAGAYFFREGDRGVSTYVIEEGRVTVLKAWDGKETALSELGRGDCFGEVALLDFGPRSASVQAIEETRALELTPAILRAIQAVDLEQFLLITMNMARELSRRLRESDERLFRVRMDLVGPTATGAHPTT
jgi:CRP/FNR family cyclic AMP-dependent transcriptional regulator